MGIFPISTHSCAFFCFFSFLFVFSSFSTSFRIFFAALRSARRFNLSFSFSSSSFRILSFSCVAFLRYAHQFVFCCVQLFLEVCFDNWASALKCCIPTSSHTWPGLLGPSACEHENPCQTDIREGFHLRNHEGLFCGPPFPFFNPFLFLFSLLL